MNPFLSATASLLVTVTLVVAGVSIAHYFRKTKVKPVGESARSAAALSLGFGLLLLAFVNANTWAAGNLVFNGVLWASVIASAACLVFLQKSALREAVKLCAELLFVPILGFLFIAVLFQAGELWLLEGPNHDTLVYYEGTRWASTRPLWVEPSVVAAEWGLGRCGEGSMWIGNDCSLHRHGTYTLVAWLQNWSSLPTGNGLYSIIGFIGLFGTLLMRSLMSQVSIAPERKWLITAAGALLIVSGPWTLGPLVNANLATVLGAGALAMVIATGLTPNVSPVHRLVLMSIWASVSCHLYAESIFYAGLIATTAIIHDCWKTGRKASAICMGKRLFLFGALTLTGSNVALIAALKSLLFFREVAAGGEWTAWYVDAATWTWVGAFIAGELMGGKIASYSVAAIGAIITIIGLRTARRGPEQSIVIGLVVTSILAVLFVEIRAYRYGEHKIVHLLGLGWAVLVIGAAVRGAQQGSEDQEGTPFMTRGVIMAITAGLLFVSVDFLRRTVSLVQEHMPVHSIPGDFAADLAPIKSGDVVLVDNTQWSGISKFQKTHYLAFLIKEKGAIVAMPAQPLNFFSGGYSKAFTDDTLKTVKHVDWMINARGSDGDIFGGFVGIEPEETNDAYILSRVTPTAKAVVARGDGWGLCENGKCTLGQEAGVEVLNLMDSPARVTMEFTGAHSYDGGEALKVVDGTQVVIRDENSVSFRVDSGFHKIVLTNVNELVVSRIHFE